MDNNVRISSDENVVMNAKVEVRSPDGEWVDISRMVSGIYSTLEVGAVSQVGLKLIPTEVNLEGVLDQGTIDRLAALLGANGYEVTRELEPAA